MGGKGRVVAAAVFRMKNESQIENFCFKLGIFFIGSQKQENILGGAQMPVGFVNKQAFFFITVTDEDILKELMEIEVTTLTPLDALNTLYRLQNKLKNRWNG